MIRILNGSLRKSAYIKKYIIHINTNSNASDRGGNKISNSIYELLTSYNGPLSQNNQNLNLFLNYNPKNIYLIINYWLK